MTFNATAIRIVMLAKGFAYFDNGDYNLNIVGVRNSVTGKVITNWFDDLLTVSYKLRGEQMYHQWPITTDPGLKGAITYDNPKGVARLVPGQYRGAYQLGLHRGRYKALVQRKPVTVWRDSDRDKEYDELRTDNGLFGINIHKAGRDSVIVDNWSHGCQVFKRSAEYDEFIKLCEFSRELYGNSFTYTLLNSNDIN